MPAPSMSGKELAGRIIALEAVVMAFVGELAASQPADKNQAIFSAVKSIAHGMIDQLAPEFSPTPPLVKDIEKFADQYIEVWVEMIGKVAAQAAKAAAAAPAKK